MLTLTSNIESHGNNFVIVLMVTPQLGCGIKLQLYLILCFLIFFPGVKRTLESDIHFTINDAVFICLHTIEQDIIRLPRLFRFLQKPLAQFISVLQAPKSKEGYASIGGGSPLRWITDAQA